MRRKDVNMLSGSIIKGLLVISIPIMVMNVLQSMFNIIDMTILKSYDAGGGTAVGAVGAVGACGVLISLTTSLLIGISAGSNVNIARHIGKGDADGVEKAVGTAVAFSVVGGITLMVIGLIFAENFLRLANCAEELLPQAVLYFRLYFVGVPILMLYNFCSAALRASGDSRRVMNFSLTGGVIKVSLTIVLVAVLPMGVFDIPAVPQFYLPLFDLAHRLGAVYQYDSHLLFPNGEEVDLPLCPPGRIPCKIIKTVILRKSEWPFCCALGECFF